MVQFDSKFDAVMHAEALLAGVNMKDREIAEVSSALQRETLEQLHIILADPKARAVLRLKLLVKGHLPSRTNEACCGRHGCRTCLLLCLVCHVLMLAILLQVQHCLRKARKVQQTRRAAGNLEVYSRRWHCLSYLD